MKPRTYIVYRVVCIATGLSYIGATTKTLRKRWREHVYRAATFARNNPMYDDIRRYGKEAFKSDVLHSVEDFDAAMALEQAAIKEHGTLWPSGYNLQSGGMLGTQQHEVTKERLSEKRVGELNPFYGKTHDDETKQRFTETRKTSLAWKDAQVKKAERQIGKSWGNHTEDAKARMSAAKKGKSQSREHVEKRMAGMRAARAAREALARASMTEK